jgi:mono/diheme cytochrome c family protein
MSTRRSSPYRFTVPMLVLSSGFAPTWSQDAPGGDVNNGRTLYNDVGCYQCHGRAGQGGSFGGPAPVLAGTVVTFAAYLHVLRNPVANMPPYPESVLSDQQAADIYAYIRSLPGARNPGDIPILNDSPRSQPMN